MQEKEIIVNNKKLFYRTAGKGPVVILLHGFGEDGTVWTNQFNDFRGYTLIIPDLPGSGQSEMIDDMSMEGIAEHLALALGPHLTSPTGGRTANAQSSLLINTSNLSDKYSVGEFYYEADPLTYPLLKKFVAEHRSKSTKAEEFLWQQLRGKKVKGYKFRRQHIVGNFIADFACLSKKVIIEVDGLIHQLPENKINDEARTLWLRIKGYEVLRFTNEEVLFDTQTTLDKILETLEQAMPPPKKIYGPPLTPPTGENSTQPLLIENAKKNIDTLKSEVRSADFPPLGELKGAFLIGHSLGGYITLAFAEKYPELLNGFGLFHSTAYADSEEKKETRKKGIRFIQQCGAYEFLKTTIPNLYSPLTKAENPAIIEKQIAASHNFSDAALVSYYTSMMQRPDRTNVLKQTKLPVLFILGKYDNAVPLQEGLKLCSMPDLSYIHVIERSGHMGMKEEPNATKNILSDFLKNIHHQTQ